MFIMAEVPMKPKKNLSQEARKRKREKDRRWARTKINIGVAFNRWKELRQERKFKNDAELAFFLLDYFEEHSSLTSSLSEDKGVPSMEVVVGIDEDNLSQITDSDSEDAKNETSSPSEKSEDVLDDEEASEDEDASENSCYDDSNDEDYEPPFFIQFDGTYKTNRCLNPVQSTSKEDTTHGAAEAVEEPAEVDKIQNPDESSSMGNSPPTQTENQENDRAEHFQQDEEKCEKTSLAKEPSCPSGSDTKPASSELGLIPPLPDRLTSNKMVKNKSGQELIHHQECKPELQVQGHISAPMVRPKKRYICLTCGKEFPRNPALKRHLVIHSGERPFKCFICGRGFTQGGNLKTHMKTHKGELHKWTLVEEKKKVEEPPVTAHICGECGMDFPEKQQLDEHRETHKKPFECLVCGKTFKWGVSLEIHQRLHSEDTPYRCSVCGKICGTAQTLQKHEAIHTGKKNFHCDQCGKSFLHENYLKIHLKTHTGERPHLCSICGKSYSRAGILREHLRVHTGEKPYTCGKCGKGFRYAQTFQKHWLTHDKKPKPPTRPLGRPKQQVLEGNDQ